MAVKRIVANIAADDFEAARAFYGGVLGMAVVMDLGWILTFAADGQAADGQAADGQAAPQVSVASQGGSGTAVPDLSVEVDDFDDVYRRVVAAGRAVEYGPIAEPWGVRRFFVRDPFGRLVNVLTHSGG